jgi:type IV secretory pathway VirJ component
MMLAAALLLLAPAPGLAGLPLHETRAPAPGGVLALVMSGDGGWAGFDQDLAAGLAAHGISVVGLDSRAYLHVQRSPETVAADVARILRSYQPAWDATRVILIGYSRGADMLPFVMNRLPEDLGAAVVQVVMIGLGPRANFKFHWEDLVRDVPRPEDQLTRPEVERMPQRPVLCFYGDDDRNDTCRAYPSQPEWRAIRHGGGHRATDAAPFVREIVASLPTG